MEFISEFFDQFWTLLGTFPDLINDWLVKSAAWFVIAATQAKIEFVKFSWEVAQEVLNQLNISATINQYWSSIDSKVMGVLTFLKLPEALNLILNAHLTRYVMGILK